MAAMVVLLVAEREKSLSVSLHLRCNGQTLPALPRPCFRLRLSLTSQYHRQALAGVCEWNGQALPALSPPADLLVRLVREVNSRRVWQCNDSGVAVRDGSIPGVYHAGEARRHRLGVLRAHREILCMRRSPCRGYPRSHAALAPHRVKSGDGALS